MSTKMKGLLRGLRYISQIFDEQEEPELQIGNPTDVRHVAHIGWDGPSTTAPCWIKQFKDEGASTATGSSIADQQNLPTATDSKDHEKRSSIGSDSSLQSPSRHRSEKSKGSRRNRSSSAVDSPRKSSTAEQSRAKLPPGLDSQEKETTNTGQKTSRRKKSKVSSGSSSKTSSKSKHTTQSADSLQYSDPGIGSAQNG